jgi:hypothetical protein
VKKTSLTSTFFLFTLVAIAQSTSDHGFVDQSKQKSVNSLKRIPAIERIVPGVSMQLYNRGHFMYDANPFMRYLIDKRYSAGLGWVERLAFDQMGMDNERVYGPRLIFQYNLNRNWSLRAQPEVLNRYVMPQTISYSNEGMRVWVPSLFVGIKKEFIVYNMFRAQVEAAGNLYDPSGKSPYQEKVALRFGFEFPMKQPGK